LVRRHPHVFGDTQVKNVDQVWANWEKIKKSEKAGTTHERRSALDGVPRHLPALMSAQKSLKKATKAGLEPAAPKSKKPSRSKNRRQVAQALFEIARQCQTEGWSAEELLRAETKRQERVWRRAEKRSQ
jgi:uncharacterized protein YabN with tetrapyrrole methylase and pyrophosphatase domain